MGRSFSASSGKNAVFSSLNAEIQAHQLRTAALNAYLKGEIIKNASLNAYTSLFTQYQLSAALNANVAQSTLLNGIVSYFKLDGNSNDSLGSFNGTDTAMTYAAAKINSGGVFNGSSSSIDLGTSATLNFSAMSFSAWVNVSNTSNYYMLLTRGPSGGCNYECRLESSTGVFNFITGGTQILAIAPGTGAFHHLCFTRSSGGAVVLYVDGAQQGSGTVPTPPSLPTSNTYLGKRADGYFLNGTMDEVGIWNRVLTQAEVTELYQLGLGDPYPFAAGPIPLTSNLAAYWKLDGDSNDALGSFNGTDTAITYSAAKINNGASGNGSTSEIALPNISVLSGGTPRTLSMWVKRGAATTIKNLFFSGSGADNCTFALFVSGTSTGDAYVSFYNRDFYTAGGFIGTSAFTHVTAVYDGGILSTSTVHIYIDGEPRPITMVGAGATSAATTTNANFSLGGDPIASRFFDGAIDEVGVWTRALAPSEVAQVYNAGLGQQYPFSSPAPVTTGLVSYWTLDGNSTDSLGIGTGTDTGVTYSAAKINSGGVFNGTTSKITIAENAAYKPSVFSASAWINTSTSGTYKEIFSSFYQDASKVAGFEFRVNNTNKLELVVGNNTNLTQGSGYQFGMSATSVNTGSFVHVAATYDGSNIRTYVNGVLDGTTAWTGGVAFISGTRVRIGVANHVTLNDINFFNGTLDEVGVWNRVLTQADITTLYNAGAGVSYPF